MAKNIGKRFEENFGKSVPKYAKFYRLPDSAQSFAKSKKLRFSKKNPFDFFLWDSERRFLYALELKTVKGKSISFERTKDEEREIHFHQIQGLNEWNKYNGIVAGFVIEFRECETTIFLHIEDFNKLISLIDKVSFNLNDLKEQEIDYLVIPQRKLKVNYKYDVDYFLKEIKR